MAISAAFAGNAGGVESRRSSRASELWNITGASGIVGDAATFKTRHIKSPEAVIGGAVAYTVSGQDVTVTSLADLGNQTVAIEVIGRT